MGTSGRWDALKNHTDIGFTAGAPKAITIAFAKPGVKWTHTLPPEYDGQTRIVSIPGGGLVAVHPDNPPLIITAKDGIQVLDLTADTDVKNYLKDDDRYKKANSPTKPVRNSDQ